MSEFDIRREVQGSAGRYVVELPEGEAVLTYRLLSPRLVSADHTFVPPAARGQGAAAALVARLVADARSEKRRIVPVCSYVLAARTRHPDWADAFES